MRLVHRDDANWLTDGRVRLEGPWAVVENYPTYALEFYDMGQECGGWQPIKFRTACLAPGYDRFELREILETRHGLRKDEEGWLRPLGNSCAETAENL